MTLVESYSGRLPVLFACARCLRTNKVRVTRFLIDTGACITCIPSFRAAEWGHDNSHPDVKLFEMRGMGFTWDGHYHSFRFGLLSGLSGLSKAPVWESSINEMPFVNNLDANYGLLGMDVIHQWKHFKIIPRSNGDGGAIEIGV